MNELNPFKTSKQDTGMIATESKRAVGEVQAMVLAAKTFPRNQAKAMDRILQACTRTSLAEVSTYEYPRGDTTVTGPSIRLAEAIAQQWGNLQFGIRELEQREGESTVEAFAWDIESNTRQTKVFQVRHIRHRRPERGGDVPLHDPRDIYELVANQGARRLRACILGIIPGDVVDNAMRQCTIAMEGEGCTEKQIKAVVGKFAELDISAQQIAKRLNHPLNEMTGAELVSLRRVYLAIKEGFAKASDMFQDTVEEQEDEEAAELRAKVAQKRKEQEEARRQAAAKQAEAQKRAQEEAQKRQAQEQAKKEAAVEKQVAAQEAKASESPQTTEKTSTATEVSPQSEQEQDEQGEPEQGPENGAAEVVNAKDAGAPEKLWEFVVERQGASGWPKRLSDGNWYDARWIGIEADTEQAAESLGVGWAKAGHPSVAHQTGNFAKKRSRKAKTEPPAPKEKPDYTDGDDPFGNY